MRAGCVGGVTERSAKIRAWRRGPAEGAEAEPQCSKPVPYSRNPVIPGYALRIASRPGVFRAVAPSLTPGECEAKRYAGARAHQH